MSEDVSAGRLYVDVVADTTGLRDDLQAKLQAASQGLNAQISAQLKVDAEQAKADIAEATRDQMVKIAATADVAEARSDIDEVAADRSVTIKAKADTAEARTDLDTAARDRSVTIKAKTDTSTLGSDIEKIGETVAEVSQKFTMGAALLDAVGAAGNLAGALVAVIAASSEAVGVIGALPGLLAAAGQGAGVVVLGMSGITKAIGAAAAAQTSFGNTSQAQALAQLQAAQQVRSAQEGLANAQIQASQSVASAQHGVVVAVQAVANAQYDAANSVAQSLHTVQQDTIALATAQYNAIQAVVSAEHALTDAEYSETEAQYNLNQARYEAAQNLVQTAFDLKGAVLDESQAALNLTEAQIKLTETNQSAAATVYMRQQAALAVQQAQLAYDESINKVQQAQHAKAIADKAGVDGSQQVIQAKHAESDATFSTQQSEQALARTRITNSQSVAEAQYTLAQAQQAAAHTQVTAAESVANAEWSQMQAVQALSNAQRTGAQSVANAQVSLKEAMLQAASPTAGLTQEAAALKEAMALLTPAGRQFVDLISSQVLPQYKKMQKAVQEAFLPGLTAGVKDALPLLGTLRTGLTLTAGVLGGLATKFGAFLGSPGVRSDLAGIMTTNAKAIGLFGDAGLHVADALRNILVASEPLVLKIADLADHLATLFDNATKAGRASGGLAAYFERAWKAATELGKIAAGIGGVLAHLFGAAAPTGNTLLESFADAVDRLEAWMDNTQNQQRMQAFFANTIPLAKQVGDAIVRIAGLLIRLSQATGGGQYNAMFTVLNIILSILTQIEKIPGLGAIINWILALSLTGVALGRVASNIKAIGEGLKVLTQIPGLKQLSSATGLTGWVQGLNKQLQAKGSVGGLLKSGWSKILGQPAVESDLADGEAGTAATGLRGVAASATTALSGLGTQVSAVVGQVKATLVNAAQAVSGAVSGMVGRVRGLVTTAASTVAGWAGSLKNAAVTASQAAWQAASAAATRLRGLASAAADAVSGWAAGLSSAIQGGVQAAVTAASSWFTRLGGMLTNAATGAAGFAARFGSSLASAASSVASFVVQTARQLAEAAVATATWVAEHAVAAAAFIAENIAMAVSATAAFIAENLATLGMVAVIAALVAAIIFLATHWRQVWGDIKNWAEDAWKFIWNGFGKYLLVLLGPAGLIALGTIEVAKNWQRIWGDIKNWAEDAWKFIWNGFGKYLLTLLGVAGLIGLGAGELARYWSDVWGAIKAAAQDAWTFMARGFTSFWNQITQGTDTTVKALRATWSAIESAFENPVKFVVDTVYDDGIAKLWNWVASKLHFPQLPVFRMAGGGRVPGYGDGDHVPALLEPGERVLSRHQVASFAGPGGTTEQGHAVLDTLAGPGGSDGPGYQAGGIVSWFSNLPGSITNIADKGLSALTGLVSSGAQDLLDAGKFIASALLNPTGTINQLMAKPLAAVAQIGGTPVGQMIGKIPGYITGQAANYVANSIGSLFGAASGGHPVAVTGTIADWFKAAMLLTGVPSNWLAPLEVIGQHESDFNPNAINLSDSNAAAGDPSRGVMQTILTTFLAFHQAGTSNNIYDPVANIAAAINYIKTRYGTVFQVPGVKAVAAGGAYVGYDTGGPLPPGATTVLNATGRDEWILSPAAVDLLGGAAAVADLNMAARAHQVAAPAATLLPAAVGTTLGRLGSATVNVFPQPQMSEEEVAAVAARRLGMMLS